MHAICTNRAYNSSRYLIVFKPDDNYISIYVTNNHDDVNYFKKTQNAGCGKAATDIPMKLTINGVTVRHDFIFNLLLWNRLQLFINQFELT